MADPFATIEDVQNRYPGESALLCADEHSRLPDWARFDAALSDVSTEIRIILQARYTPTQLGQLDDASLSALRVFAVDMSMYRVAVSFARGSDILKSRYDMAIARLEGIASGKKGALTFTVGAPAVDGVAPTPSAGEALVIAPERQFTRANAERW